MNSKLIKLPHSKPDPITRVGKIWRNVSWVFMMNIYYPIDSFIGRYHERICRSLAFAKHGWLHYDFESAYLYDIMAFKMERIYKVLESGYGVQKSENMEALKEAIAICERLFAGEYEDKYIEDHYKEYPVTEIGDPEPKRTKAQGERYRKSLMKAMTDGEADRAADIDRLATILKKHESTWWD